ncbi:hypothetical protein ACLB2K_019862 [Fragaria x ananassa]
MSDMRFMFGHLVQLKYILPEVIETKKMLVVDKQTGCVKPDLRVALNVQALQNDVKFNKTLNLRRVFRDRLVEVLRSHPEETLPHPFNYGQLDIYPNGVKLLSSSSIPES